MTGNQKTELIFLLDRSGSMGGLEKDTIGGFNAMLKKQKKEPGIVTVTTILFDHETEILHDRVDLGKISPLTERDYWVRGSTALLDAAGLAIRRTVNSQRRTSPSYRADRVLFVMTTDGYENASRIYGYEEVKAMIETEKRKYGWEFIFLGANIDAVVTAERFGIDADHAVNYHADARGTRYQYEAVNCAVSQIRSGKGLQPQWKAATEADYNGRRRNY